MKLYNVDIHWFI